MLTKNRLRRGEGKLKYFVPGSRHVHRRRNMDDDVRNEEEKKIGKKFYTMADRVEKLFSRLQKLEKAGENASEGQGSMHGDNGGDPPLPPPTSESSSSSSHYHHRNSVNFFNLDVKFYLPIYNGESNTKNINKWIRRIEVYCRI